MLTHFQNSYTAGKYVKFPTILVKYFSPHVVTHLYYSLPWEAKSSNSLKTTKDTSLKSFIFEISEPRRHTVDMHANAMIAFGLAMTLNKMSARKISAFLLALSSRFATNSTDPAVAKEFSKSVMFCDDNDNVTLIMIYGHRAL